MAEDGRGRVDLAEEVGLVAWSFRGGPQVVLEKGQVVTEKGQVIREMV